MSGIKLQHEIYADKEDLVGQWIGNYSGSETGTFVLDLERAQGRYIGHAYLFPQDTTRLATVVFLNSHNLDSKQHFESTWVRPFRPDRQKLLSQNKLLKKTSFNNIY